MAHIYMKVYLMCLFAWKQRRTCCYLYVIMLWFYRSGPLDISLGCMRPLNHEFDSPVLKSKNLFLSRGRFFGFYGRLCPFHPTSTPIQWTRTLWNCSINSSSAEKEKRKQRCQHLHEHGLRSRGSGGTLFDAVDNKYLHWALTTLEPTVPSILSFFLLSWWQTLIPAGQP